eukprot:CAMPEP_0177677360 /NCGR_PEP_ID=MMETSP0447-20121125/28344_1 /TAXON_ID=0 /ORGANISM="Stygamoeba regulata, Strain BSH-02190019" /LENGTH=106 /DNA_ID=CAMNT_0019186111 /DNA_START=138 /DNA_END=454 /DNA_ORIENTATION=+
MSGFEPETLSSAYFDDEIHYENFLHSDDEGDTVQLVSGSTAHSEDESGSSEEEDTGGLVPLGKAEYGLPGDVSNASAESVPPAGPTMPGLEKFSNWGGGGGGGGGG